MAALLAVAAASVAVAAADAAAFARRPPPRLQVRELALRPAIGEAEASGLERPDRWFQGEAGELVLVLLVLVVLAEAG